LRLVHTDHVKARRCGVHRYSFDMIHLNQGRYLGSTSYAASPCLRVGEIYAFADRSSCAAAIMMDSLRSQVFTPGG
jgi:hypothetical protein